MVELDRLEQKILHFKELFRDIPQTRIRFREEIEEAKERYLSEKEHYEEQKLEITYLKDEIQELDQKIALLKKELEAQREQGSNTETFESELEREEKTRLIRHEELISSETLIKDTEEVVKETESIYKTTKQDNETTLNELAEKEANFEREIKDIDRKKDKIFQKLEQLSRQEDLVSLYKQISEAFPGGVVAQVQFESCSRCFMQVTPQLLNELFRDQQQLDKDQKILTCPSCSCVLYLDPEDVE